MYFAVDSRDPQRWLDDLLQAIDGASDCHWSALVDGVFDHGGKPFASPVPRIPLYGPGSTLQDLLPASPYLLPLDRRAGTDLGALLTALGKHCQGRPMLSFVASWQPVDRLAQHWQPCLWPEVGDDGTRYLLRFADTRVLAALPGALNPAVWDQLTAPLLHWCHVGRAGQLETLRLTEPRTEPETYPNEPLVLPQADLDRMVDAAMPDAILDLMHRESPDTLSDTDRAEAHRLVARACALGKAHQIEATPDIALLASYALITGDAGLQAPELLALLKERGRAPGALGEYVLSARSSMVAVR